MNILVTGAKGFIGKNLTAGLRNRKDLEVYEFDIDTEPALLDEYCREAGFVYHLAGMSRAEEQSELMEAGFAFSSLLLETLKKHKNTCPVMMGSSIQAALDNSYGRSKRAGEDLVISYGRATGAEVLIYRFPNVFGKWSRPDYNSMIAALCHNMANDLPIAVDDPDLIMKLVYIDDGVDELIRALDGNQNGSGLFCEVPVFYFVKLGDIAALLASFKDSRQNLRLPDMSDAFTKKLYATYTSFLPQDQFGYLLKMNVDDRGSFTEFIKSRGIGQISVNTIKPGVVKGNHWHHTKCEKFLAVSGKGIIRFREMGSVHVIEYKVGGDALEAMDIPAGYTHNIENTGAADLVVIMWANEEFDQDKPDTYFMEV